MENNKEKILEIFKNFRNAENEMREFTHLAKTLYVHEWNHVERVDLVDETDLAFIIGRFDQDAWRSGEDDVTEITTLTLSIDEFIGISKLKFTQKVNDKIRADKEDEEKQKVEALRKAQLSKLDYMKKQVEALAIELGVS